MEKKIAVLFPGIGYHTDKPLLYYSKKLARKRGYEIVEVKYGPLPSGVKGNAEKMRKAFEMALIYATEQLAEIDFAAYDAVLFISKSVGTAVAAAYANKFAIIRRLWNRLMRSDRTELYFMEQQIRGRKQSRSRQRAGREICRYI